MFLSNFSYNKDEIMTDATASLYGLGTGTVPDDVLGWIGKYNEHWWSLLHGEAYEYTTKVAVLNDATRNKTLGSTAAAYYIKYGSNLWTDDGEFDEAHMNNKIELPANMDQAFAISVGQQLAAASPCYVFYNGSMEPYSYIPSGATFDEDGDDTTMHIEYSASYGYQVVLDMDAIVPYKHVTMDTVTIQVPEGETTYEHSTDRNAYPDSGTVDGIKYAYLGVPFDAFPSLLGSSKIEAGSYKGTGTSQDVVLNVGFTPILVIVAAAAAFGLGAYGNAGLIAVRPATRSYVKDLSGSASMYATLTWGDNSLSWSVSGGNSPTASELNGAALNTSGITYVYFAIG